MVEILNRCDYLYNNYPDCIDKNTNENKNGDCLTCTQNNFRGMNNDSYDCLKKLCTYTMFYGPLYVNEIYNFLVQSNFLKILIEENRKYIKNNSLYGFNIFTQNINIPIQLNVMSLGCGFGPDDIALNKYRDNHLDWNVNFNYLGYDKEPLWNFITQNNALPITADLLNGMNFQNVNILFINKLFSTLKKLSYHNDFLNVFRDALEELPTGAFVVFNDINSDEKGRDVFDEFTKYNFLEVVNKYYFEGYTGNYIKLGMNDIVTNFIDNPAIAHKTYLNKTVFFLYRKV